MDFETVRYLRFLFAVIFAVVGAGIGFKYFQAPGAAGGLVVGAIFGWNLVDFFKGRAQK